MKEIISSIQEAVLICMEHNADLKLGPEACVRNKNALIDSVSEKLDRLKVFYKEGIEQEQILKAVEEVAQKIIQCGDLYFRFKPNDTIFLTEQFLDSAHQIVEKFSISEPMKKLMSNTYESWHWHGH
jgi:hypothetical protein